MMFPAVNTAPAGRLLVAFAGSHWTNDADRARARHLEEIAPGCGNLIRQARAWHQRVSLWAAGLGCLGGIVCGAGLPAEPEAYRGLSGAVLPGTWILADPDEGVTAANRMVRAPDPSGRVSAVRGTALDPEDILRHAAAAGISGRITVHSRFGAQFWEAGPAAAAVGGWGRLLPAGSVLAMSLWLADSSTPEGREFTAALGPVQAHTAEDVRGWFRVPGLRVTEYRVRRCRAGAVATIAARAGA